jgi:methylated-DNA-[protein]-cysteine S-methyltransferase
VSSLRQPFAVVGGSVRLAVLTDGKAVTEIRLGGEAKRAAEGALECLVERELTEYLAGLRRQFSFPIRPAGTPFQQRVWRALERIPYGATRTYGDIAGAIGKPKAARAVGMANHHNPIPIVIPCHRVVAAGGKLGGYGGGVELKRELLNLEGASE